MLIGLATGLRFRLGLAFAAFAALCFVAPPAVLAFGHGTNTLDCVAHADKVKHGKASAHHHGKASAHHVKHQHGHHAPSPNQPPQNDQPGPAADHQMTCCGLFCLSALAADIGLLEPAAMAGAHNPARDVNSLSRAPERLDRPPISLAIV